MYKKQAYAWPRLAQSELSTQARNLVPGLDVLENTDVKERATTAILTSGLFILVSEIQSSL